MTKSKETVAQQFAVVNSIDTMKVVVVLSSIGSSSSSVVNSIDTMKVLLASYHLQLTTCYSLLTTCYLLLTAHY